MIPKVRTWKVTAVETGRVVYIDTINKRFARMIAISEHGMPITYADGTFGKTLKISVVRHTCSAGSAPCPQCLKERSPYPLPMAGAWCGR